jgi:TolB-like protein
VGGEKITIRVMPFEVRGQEDGADYVGRTYARSLADNLARAEGLRILVGPDAEATQDEATHRLGGTVTRDGKAVRVDLRLTEADGSVAEWTAEAVAGVGDLSGTVSPLARRAVAQLGAAYPDDYDYPGYVTGGPEMAASPTTASAGTSWRTGDLERFLETSSDLVKMFPDDPAAHVLNSWALSWPGTRRRRAKR